MMEVLLRIGHRIYAISTAGKQRHGRASQSEKESGESELGFTEHN
jgi:hypothetical protein